jgi:hypothetical protein
MRKLKFRHFAGEAHYKNMNVAVYNDPDDDDLRILIAEDLGNEICRAVVNAEKYAELREQWTQDGMFAESDVRITIAALEWLGAFDKSGYRGNKNAAKSDMDRLSSTITARCLPADKARWVKTANAEGVKLTEWINRTLNEKVRDAYPTD